MVKAIKDCEGQDSWNYSRYDVDLQTAYSTPCSSVTLMSELQAPVDSHCADCEGVMEIALQIGIIAL